MHAHDGGQRTDAAARRPLVPESVLTAVLNRRFSHHSIVNVNMHSGAAGPAAHAENPPPRQQPEPEPEPQPERRRPRLAVLGAGDYGRAFATRAVRSGYVVTLGSRNPNKNRELMERTGAAISTPEDTVGKSDVIIVCLPFDFYDSLPFPALAGKVVVDVSNSTPKKSAAGGTSNAEDLQAMAPKSQVVKAFNVVSAYALENNMQGGKKVPVAGDETEAKAVVAQLVTDLGFTASDVGSLKAARQIEKIPLQLFPSWRTSAIVTAVILALFWFYSLFKYQICTTIESNRPWDLQIFTNALMVNFNRALAMTGITVLASTYLPGVFAAYLQLKRGTKYRQFPGWLARWLLVRKQLFLCALMLAVLHGIISIAMSSPFYLAQAYDQPAILLAKVRTTSSTATRQVAVFNRLRQGRVEFGLTVGAATLGLLTVIGVTSLPSVGDALSWREFRFVQSTLGWSGLVAAALHNAMLGWDFMVLNYTCSTPSALQVGMYLPTITVALKLPLLLPVVSSHLAAIRGGMERSAASAQ